MNGTERSHETETSGSGNMLHQYQIPRKFSELLPNQISGQHDECNDFYYGRELVDARCLIPISIYRTAILRRASYMATLQHYR